MNFFDKIAYQIDKGEASFQTFLSAVVPYLVPIIPATITGIHFGALMEVILPDVDTNVYWILGLVAGVVMEFLGLAAVYRTTILMEKNKKLARADQYSVWKPMMAFIWYLAVMIFGNILLELWAGATWTRIIPVALFSSLSFPVFLMVSDKAIGDARLREKEERIATRNTRNVAPNSLQYNSSVVQVSQVAPDWRKIKDKLQKDDIEFLKSRNAQEIMQKFNLQSERAAYDWKKRASRM